MYILFLLEITFVSHNAIFQIFHFGGIPKFLDVKKSLSYQTSKIVFN